MADIFLSYAREDAGAVERLAAALQEAGYSSWWDRNLTSGSRYLKETEAELKAARAVLVVWSKASVESNWVADEAMAGREENKLAAVTFDASMPPLGFRQFQVTDFSHWKGAANEPQFQSLIGGLSRLAPLGPPLGRGGESTQSLEPTQDLELEAASKADRLRRRCAGRPGRHLHRRFHADAPVRRTGAEAGLPAHRLLRVHAGKCRSANG